MARIGQDKLQVEGLARKVAHGCQCWQRSGWLIEPEQTDASDHVDRPGKTRTWWHPLLARLWDHELATACTVWEDDVWGAKLTACPQVTLPVRLTRPR